MKTEEARIAEQALMDKLEGAGLNSLRSPGPEQNEPEPEPVVETTEPVVEEVLIDTQAKPEGDPAIAAYLRKYGGDVEKALQAAVQAQRKLGEMGNELGEHRQQAGEFEQLQSEIESLREQVSRPQPQHVDQATVDWFESAVIENPVQAMEWAREQRNEVLYRRGLETWKNYDPFGAATYVNQIQLQQLEQRMSARPAEDPNQDMQFALGNVLNENPHYGQYAQDIGRIADNYPAVSKGLVGSTREEKEQTILALFRLAEADTLRMLALEGAGATVETTAPQVVTQTSVTPQDEHQPTADEVFRAAFKDEAKHYKGERVVPVRLSHPVQ